MQVNNPFTGQTAQQQQNSPMTDQEYVFDAISSQKSMTGGYNNAANEAANDNLRNDFMNILRDEHQIQYDMFVEAQNKGWYPVSPAQQQKITQAQQKFQNMTF